MIKATAVDKEELREKEEYALNLRNRDDIPTLDFEQGPDGVFR
jgi:hypothetical protein